jgi:septum site-determining protein MinC
MAITIKGIRDGLLVTIGDGSWDHLQQDLMDQLSSRAEFIKGSNLTLDVGSHVIKAAQMGKLRDGLADVGLALTTVLSHSVTTEATSQALGLGTRLRQMHPSEIARPLNTTIEGDQAILVQRTLRSGFKLEHSGHITVLGDVNPGAEITAGGSILIWGRMRGVAHAGAEGDEKAMVAALLMAPTQLRIAGKIAIAPSKDRPSAAEVALLRDGQVVVQPWDGKPELIR